MGRLEFDYMTHIGFSEPVDEHTFVLRCLPRKDRGIHIESAAVEISPTAAVTRQLDSFGNTLTVGSIRAPHTQIEYRSQGAVRVDRYADGLDAGPRSEPDPEPHPLYRYPSPLTSPDAGLISFAESFGRAHATVGARMCAELSHTIHETMEYAPRTTSVRTTAAEAFAARHGVCQDFAHVLSTLLRLYGVPARYVSGLAEGEGQTHAWVEAYVGSRWRGLDPTRDKLADDGYLPLACGRDWMDCPIENGSFHGYVTQEQTVHFTVRRTA